MYEMHEEAKNAKKMQGLDAQHNTTQQKMAQDVRHKEMQKLW